MFKANFDDWMLSLLIYTYVLNSIKVCYGEMIPKHVIIVKFMDICKAMIYEHVGVSEIEKFIVLESCLKAWV